MMNIEIIDFRNQAKSLGGRTLRQFLRLGLSTLLCNMGRICLAPLKLVEGSNKAGIPRELIVLGFGGIGNHLMLVPMIRCLKESYPQTNIHVVASSRVCAELMKRNQHIASLSVMDIAKMNRLGHYWHAGRALKALKPDTVIAASGTDPVAGSAISFLAGAGLRVGEDWKGRGFLYSHKIKADQAVSELEQNMALLNVLRIKPKPAFPWLCLSAEEIEGGRRWIAQQRIPRGATILGIHPGCGRGQEWKRWEIGKYIRVSKQMTEIANVWSIFFFGPDEDDLVSSVEEGKAGDAVICQGVGSIRKTAAIIRCCDLFLANDSGLRHVAAALGVRTVGVFGPTSMEKNFLGGDRHKAVFLEHVACRPCHYTKWWLACGDEPVCLKLLSPKTLVNVLSEMSREDSPATHGKGNDGQKRL